MKILPIKVSGNVYEITFLPDGWDEWQTERYDLSDSGTDEAPHYGDHETVPTTEEAIASLVAELRLRFPDKTAEVPTFHDPESGKKVTAKAAEKAFAEVVES